MERDKEEAGGCVDMATGGWPVASLSPFPNAHAHLRHGPMPLLPCRAQQPARCRAAEAGERGPESGGFSPPRAEAGPREVCHATSGRATTGSCAARGRVGVVGDAVTVVDNVCASPFARPRPTLPATPSHPAMLADIRRAGLAALAAALLAPSLAAAAGALGLKAAKATVQSADGAGDATFP